jgi:hypothetical protein
MEIYPDYEKSPLANLTKAFESAWAVLQTLIRDSNKHEELKRQLQRMLLTLAADGLTDPEQLKSLALEKLSAKPNPQTVPKLIEKENGPLEPETMPNEYADAVHELVRAKIEQRTPQAKLGEEKRPKARVLTIMDALKKAVQAKGRENVRDAVRRRMGDKAHKEQAASSRRRSEPAQKRRRAD